jgi:shikimate kinase
MMLRNIVVTGFMGTGKSVIGQNLASKLRYPFLDMDALIEKRQRRTIREIFETEGEAYFRQIEAELCRELAGWQGHVIATGGGTLVSPENQATFAAENLVICLDCEPEVLWLRLANARNRPMLDSPDRQARLMALLEARQPAYAQIKQHVDTSNRPIYEIVAEIEGIWRRLKRRAKLKGARQRNAGQSHRR